MRHRLGKNGDAASSSNRNRKKTANESSVTSWDLSEYESIGEKKKTPAQLIVATEMKAARNGDTYLLTPTGAEDVQASFDACDTVAEKVIFALGGINTWLKQTVEDSTVLGNRRIARLSEHTKSLTLNYCNQCLKAILEKLVCDKDHNYENVPDAILIELSTNWESVVIALSKIVISIYRGVRIPSLTEDSTTEPTLSGPEDSDARRSMVSKSVTALIGTGIHATLAKGLTANGLEHIYYVSVIALLAGLEKQKEEANYEEAKEMVSAFNELSLRTMYTAPRVASFTAIVNMFTKSETSTRRLSLEMDDDEASLSPADVDSEGCLILCKLLEKSIRRELKKPLSSTKTPFHELDLDPLLFACSKYLEVVRPDITDATELAPFKTIKFLLKAMAESLGKRIFDFTQGISPNSALFGLLESYIKPDETSSTTTMMTMMTPATELANIFARVQANTSGGAAIEELYDFQQQHPNESIEYLLSNVSEAFRVNIQTGLQNVAAKRRGSLTTTKESNRTSSSTTGPSLSMASLRARLAANNNTSSTLTPSNPSTAVVGSLPVPSVTTTTTTATTTTTSTTAAAGGKKPLDLNSLRARLSKMKL